MTFCKTSQFPRKSICDGVPFRKDVSPLVCNCTKMDAFTSVFLWIDKTQIFLVHFIQASSRICSTGLFKNFGKLAGKRLFRIFFLIKLYTIKPATLLKREFTAQMFYCEFCEIVLSTFFTELLGWVFLISIQPS